MGKHGNEFGEYNQEVDRLNKDRCTRAEKQDEKVRQRWTNLTGTVMNRTYLKDLIQRKNQYDCQLELTQLQRPNKPFYFITGDKVKNLRALKTKTKN
jgi:hypothetical protein